MINFTEIKEQRERLAELTQRADKLLSGGSRSPHAASNRRHREVLNDVRDISATCPAISNENLRAEVLESLPRFCEVVLGQIFYLPFASMHYRLMEKTETIIRSGGQDCTACPRGSGKTSIYRAGALWGLLNGFRENVLLIGSNQPKANKLATGLINMLSKFKIMLDLFPEVCWPFWSLEGIIQRKLLWNGKPLFYALKKDRLILPDTPVEWNKSALGSIASFGLHTALRGEEFTRPDGRTVRPDGILFDDPQTEASAGSRSQTEDRMDRIDAAVTGMSGPDVRLAAMAAVTCIEDEDLADRLLKDPAWGGEIFPLMPKIPQSEKWLEYAEILRDDLRERKGRERINQFYSDHRTELDAGGSIYWDHKKKPDEVSALQGAMEIYLLKPKLFWADYQQQPAKAHDTDEFELTADTIQNRLNGLPRYVVPTSATMLTSFVDVQHDLFYYAIIAFGPGFGGDCIDYGTFPDQRREYYLKRKAQHKFENLTLDGKPLAGMSLEGRWLSALRDFTGWLLSRDFKREGGGTDRIQRMLLDCQEGEFTKVGYSFIRSSPHRSIMLPSHGEPIGATSLTIAERKPKDGQRKGEEWVIDRHQHYQDARIHYNANHWKAFLRNRLTCDVAARGALRFFGDDPRRHRLIADHILSEKPLKVSARGREVVLFGKPSGDNDLLDCLSGCCIAASSLGMNLDGLDGRKGAKKRKLAEKVSELQI